jgi:hypothetical protein
MTLPLAAALQAARVYDLEQQRFHGMPIHRAHPAGYFYGLSSRHRDSCPRPNTARAAAPPACSR